jgi:hypothetical protein
LQLPETGILNSGLLPDMTKSEAQDTLFYRQLLYNGRIWKSHYSNVMGHEFFLTKNWLDGDVTINGRTFNNIPLRYDVYNDQLLAMVNPGTFVQLNKEAVKRFKLNYEKNQYFFENFNAKSVSSSKGYGQVIYNGDICFLIMYFKQIKLLAVDNKYDEFYQTQSIYLLKDGQFYRISGKRDLFKTLSDREEEIQKYIRDKGIKVSKKMPETFIPVLQFYDSFKR